MVMQTATPLDAVQHPRRAPARVCCCSKAMPTMRAVLERIDGIGLGTDRRHIARVLARANRLANFRGATHIHHRTARRLAGREGLP